MTISAITTDNIALAAGLPFEIRPDSAQFAVLVTQEPGGGFAPVQSSGGTIATSGTGSGGGGTSSAVTLLAGTANVGTFALSTGTTMAVTGTFWQTTQPISAASLPLPSGAATAAGLTTLNTTLGSPFQAGGSIGNTAFGAIQSGAWTVGLSTGQTITLGGSNSVTLAAGSASVGTFTLASSTFTLAAGASNIGTVAFAASSSVTLAASTSNIGTIAGSSANIPVYLAAVSSGGASLASFTNAAASSLSGTIKASSGQLMAYDISNSGTTGAWVRFYAAATETVGAGTPVLRLYVPPTSARAQGVDLGAVFSTGIVVTATAGAADSDTSTFTSANQVQINAWWK